MSDLLFRQYEPGELGPDGYPPEWHSLPQGLAWPVDAPPIRPGDGLKHIVRRQAGNRCLRCGHPYELRAGEWSPCDKRCTHGGPIRYHFGDEDWCDWGGVAELGWPALRGRIGEEAVVVVEAQWRILTVHHLDNDKANCRWWNLAALCQRCHLQIQGKVQMARVYPFEHSEWFRPYAAGYYAWAYLGQDLTRAEVDERMDDLLGLERMT